MCFIPLREKFFGLIILFSLNTRLSAILGERDSQLFLITVPVI